MHCIEWENNDLWKTLHIATIKGFNLLGNEPQSRNSFLTASEKWCNSYNHFCQASGFYCSWGYWFSSIFTHSVIQDWQSLWLTKLTTCSMHSTRLSFGLLNGAFLTSFFTFAQNDSVGIIEDDIAGITTGMCFALLITSITFRSELQGKFSMTK